MAETPAGISNKFGGLQYNINGDRVVAFGDISQVQNLPGLGDIGSHTLAGYFQSPDANKQDVIKLGMIELFAHARNYHAPMLKDIYDNAQILEVDTPDTTIQYQFPIETEQSVIRTIADTSGDFNGFPGKGESVFYLILNKKLGKNDTIAANVTRGKQISVVDDLPIEPYSNGFKTWFRIAGGSRGSYYDVDLMRADVAYTKIHSVMGEFDEDLSEIQLVPAQDGWMTLEFKLDDVQGVQTAMTRKAALSRNQVLSDLTAQMQMNIEEDITRYGANGMPGLLTGMLKGRDANGRGIIDKTSAFVADSMQMLVMFELHKLEVMKNLFARAATIKTNKGQKSVNEGLWHQFQRGHIINYARTITEAHLEDAANYVFRDKDVPVEERMMIFEAGSEAKKQIDLLIQKHNNFRLTQMAPFFAGTQKTIDETLIEGPLNDMKLKIAHWGTGYIPGVGQIKVNLNTSWDYLPGADRRTRGFGPGGKSYTSYSLTIWDASDPKYTNASTFNIDSKVKNATLKNGGKTTANLYLIRPKVGGANYGYRQGMMPLMNDLGSTGPIVSSLKGMSSEIWATTQSSLLLLDTTRAVIIQKEGTYM